MTKKRPSAKTTDTPAANPWRRYALFMVPAVAALVIAAVYIFTRPTATTDSSRADGPCSGQHRTIVVTIRNQAFNPSDIEAWRCDRLIIRNDDDRQHLPALGPHDHHADYPGFEETLLTPGQQTTTVLSQDGRFRLHDHLDDAIEAELVIR